MDKWQNTITQNPASLAVSTLVLMDSWINGIERNRLIWISASFNPCFNGFMDKWYDSYNTEGRYSVFQPLF